MARKATKPARPSGDPDKRKIIGFDQETYDALDQMAREKMMTWQELAEEAFRDLLKKHGRPLDLRDALRKSAKAHRKDD